MEQAVREINANKELSPEEKARQINELFKHHSKRVQLDKPIVSCSHYVRNCDIETPCCEKWYPCRICHDENETHNLVRSSTNLMKCRSCNLIQPVAMFCSNKDCQWKSTIYYCQSCRLWSDDPKKDIFHCSDCGISTRFNEFFFTINVNRMPAWQYTKRSSTGLHVFRTYWTNVICGIFYAIMSALSQNVRETKTTARTMPVVFTLSYSTNTTV